MWASIRVLRRVSSRGRSTSAAYHSYSTCVAEGRTYDVIVVGGGHAGTEAACAAARMGADTLLITHKMETVGEMSCNPSFGGVGKGHLMREVDALDGVCAKICDKSGIQYRVLNRSKGPAVWGPRAQIDRKLYKRHLQEEVFNTPGLEVLAAPVEDLIVEEAEGQDAGLAKTSCKGVILGTGSQIRGRAVVLTTGTFLRGMITLGTESWPAGRLGDEPAIGLANTLHQAGFKLGRLKTGTPPRIARDTIDYSKTIIQKGDDPPEPFSYLNDKVWIKAEDQVLCHLIRTTERVVDVVMKNQHLNRHVLEEVTGPRYCPSIESKVMRFPTRLHQVWLEPEGLDSDLVYPQGLSCTLPETLQQELVNACPGLEKAKIVTPGYGVEYDYVDPRQLQPSLQTHLLPGLFLAGQINGTTGYEEAAAQGIIAGINAVQRARWLPPFTVGRTDGYVGVLIDDLTTHGTNEPYRMFTSRAEFRVLLRPDNADMRLTAKGFAVGVVGKQRYERTEDIRRRLAESLELLSSFTQSQTVWGSVLHGTHTGKTGSKSALDMLSGNHVTTHMMAEAYPETLGFLSHDRMLAHRIKTEAQYRHIIAEQLAEINEVRRDEQLELPLDFDYSSLENSRCIGEDVLGTLALVRPTTIAAASRIPGVTPAALVTLLRHVKTHRRNVRKQ